MSGGWNPKLHPRDGENGRFTHNWEKRLAEQLDAALKRGDMSRQYLPTTSRAQHGQPIAGQRGYVRIGDRPDRQGAADGAYSPTIAPSTHPDAGGIWIDPARPGTNHAPRFLNDNGHAIADLRPVPSKSERHKVSQSSRRREDWGSTPDGQERRPAAEGGKIGRRYEGAPEAVVKDLRRAQARTRAETARQGRRRTPRGTAVEGWMDAVNSRIGQKGRT